MYCLYQHFFFFYLLLESEFKTFTHSSYWKSIVDERDQNRFYSVNYYSQVRNKRIALYILLLHYTTAGRPAVVVVINGWHRTLYYYSKNAFTVKKKKRRNIANDNRTGTVPTNRTNSSSRILFIRNPLVSECHNAYVPYVPDINPRFFSTRVPLI